MQTRSVPRTNFMSYEPFEQLQQEMPLIRSVTSSRPDAPDARDATIVGLNNLVCTMLNRLSLEPWPEAPKQQDGPRTDVLIDMLIIVCSPGCAPLPKAFDEAHALAGIVRRAGRTAHILERGGAAAINALLQERSARVVWFIGHGDATHPTHNQRTLALTAEGGSVEYMQPKTLANIFGAASPRLELVVLNSCQSAASDGGLPSLCEIISRGYGVPTVGWRTIAADTAAQIFAIGLMGCLAPQLAREPPLSLAQAFEAGKRAVEATSRPRTAARDRVDAWALADPAPGGTIQATRGDGRVAAGVPVLIRRWQWREDVSTAPRLPPPADMPCGSSCFTGQEPWLQRLSDGFFPILHLAAGAPEAEQRMVATRQAVLQPKVVRGLGGLGKTELAVQYALQQWHAGRYQCVFFVVVPDTPLEPGPGVIEGSLERELLRRMVRALPLAAEDKAQMAEEADLEVVRRTVHEWLGSHAGWLLLVDNADDAASLKPGAAGFVRSCLPPKEAPGHVLLTSRVGTQDFGAIGASALQLQLLSKAVVADGVTAAEVLLLRHAREALGHDVCTDVDVAKMVTRLEPSERAAVAWLAGDEGVAGLPLAIQQAGDAIRENEDETFAGYCELYRARRIAFFADGPEGKNREAQSVHTTFCIGFERLERQSPAAAQLLALRAYLAPEAIPLSMFTQALPGQTELQALLQAAASPAEALRPLVRAAQKLSLLTPGGSGEAQTVSMHRMVQQAMQRWAREKRGGEWAAEAIGLLSELLEAAMPGIEDGMACTGEAMERFHRAEAARGGAAKGKRAARSEGSGGGGAPRHSGSGAQVQWRVRGGGGDGARGVGGRARGAGRAPPGHALCDGQPGEHAAGAGQVRGGGGDGAGGAGGGARGAGRAPPGHAHGDGPPG